MPQADEIEAAAWMPLEEYAALPFIHGRPLLLRTLECCLACVARSLIGVGFVFRSGQYAALPFIRGRPLLLRTLECCLA